MAAKHPDLVLGFEDDVWWSRAAQPARQAWSDDKPVRLGFTASPHVIFEAQYKVRMIRSHLDQAVPAFFFRS